MSQIATHLKPRLRIVDGHITTTSLDVAEKFGKSHDNVLRDIRNLLVSMPEDSAEFASLSFEEVKESMTYKDSSGTWVTKETSRTGNYRMTRDGFSLLVMGFTGKEALKWKVSYITAFNLMERNLLSIAGELKKLEAAKARMDQPLDFSDPYNLPPRTPELFLRLLEIFDHKFAFATLVWWAIGRKAHLVPVSASMREIEEEVHFLVRRSALHRALILMSGEGGLFTLEQIGGRKTKYSRITLNLNVLAARSAERDQRGGLGQLFMGEGYAALVNHIQTALAV